MTYQEAMAFIDKTKEYGSILGLESIKNLMQELGDVQDKLAVIHVAGTNGKGSVCAFLAQILKEASYQVGRYSSPAVFCYEEIYQIDGKPISPDTFASVAEEVAEACQRLVQSGKPHPTVFEVETAIAFVYFYRRKCDVVVLETGLGGAMDATNLIKRPLCSVLTSISMDHMGFLGNSLAEIATVKAGIIKQGCPVVSVSQKPEAMQVVETQAALMNAGLMVSKEQLLEQVYYDADGMRFEFPLSGQQCEFQTRLTGQPQLQNAVLAITVAELLISRGYQITNASVVRGLANTVWHGRFETICQKPRIILDGAHNEDAARKLQETIENCFTNTEITYIIGVLADKEYQKVLKILLPQAKRVYTVTPDNPRALSAEDLAAEVEKYYLHHYVVCAKTVEWAVKSALETTAADGVILAFGSLSYLGQVRGVVEGIVESSSKKY